MNKKLNSRYEIKLVLYFRRYFTAIILSILCMLLVNVLSLAFPWAIKIVLDDVLPRYDLILLNKVIMGLLAILVLRALFGFVRKYLSNKVGEKIVCNLREEIYRKIYKLSIENIRRITPNQILSRITQDVENIRYFIITDAVEFIYAIVSLVLILFVLFWINIKLTLLAVITLPFFVLLYSRLMPHLSLALKRYREVNSQIFSRINEAIQGMPVIKTLNAEENEKSKFKGMQDNLLTMLNKSHWLNVSLWVIVDFFSSLGLILVLWVGAQEVMSGKMTFGELMAYYSYLGMFFVPVIRLTAVNNSFQESRASLLRINEIMAVEEQASSVINVLNVDKLLGQIEFKNVYFSYMESKPILRNISFEINPGEIVGIVGPSGAGKTSLINLFLRLYEPARGDIFIDRHNLRELDIRKYREHVAVVMQDDFLFDGTIEENIAFGLNNVSSSDVVTVAQVAQIHEFIDGLKGGYKTNIGERGLRLSCGQRQRIAIARALLRKPSVLILDEATSSLDAITENLVQKAVIDFMKGKNIIIVAHRFSTIMEADKIFVIKDGMLIEQGSHKELIARKSFYSELYFEQFKDEDLITRNII